MIQRFRQKTLAQKRTSEKAGLQNAKTNKHKNAKTETQQNVKINKMQQTQNTKNKNKEK